MIKTIIDMEKKWKKTQDNDIVFSQTVHAGSRIYYVDVKKTRTDEMYLAITESKRVQHEDSHVVDYEKHKIFLYREDFSSFMGVLKQAVNFVNERQGEPVPRHASPILPDDEAKTADLCDEIELNIEF